MLTIIIFLAITLFFLLWSIFDRTIYGPNINTLGVSIFFGIVLLVTLLTLCNRQSRFDYEVERYQNLKQQVEDYNSMPDSLKNVSFEYDIRNDVIKMNNTISEHRVMSKSIWVGPWNSKKVGNLEKLRIVSKRE